jgi:DNA-binding NtrC family response regulator
LQEDTRDAVSPRSGPDAEPCRVVVIVTPAAVSQPAGSDEQNAVVIDLPSRAARASPIDPEALRPLVADRWSGNVQELCNVIERALALSAGDAVTPDELPQGHASAPLAPTGTASAAPFEPTLDLRAQLKQHERELIYRALERTNGHQRKAAELLGLPLRTLERKLQKLSNRPARSH